MTSTSVVAPVVPPTVSPGQNGSRQPDRGTARRVLPVANLVSPRAASLVYGVAAMDCNGRVAEKSVINALGWVPGTRLDIRESGGLVLVRADGRGVFSLSRRGCLRLPANVRHWAQLTPGDRVLLVADTAAGHLIVYPPAVLDAMVSRFQAALLGGESA